MLCTLCLLCFSRQFPDDRGGVFEDMEHPIYLYVIGIIGFLFLLSIGTKYYNKGIKEK